MHSHKYFMRPPSKFDTHHRFKPYTHHQDVVLRAIFVLTCRIFSGATDHSPFCFSSSNSMYKPTINITQCDLSIILNRYEIIAI
jgi:hypothetical protein